MLRLRSHVLICSGFFLGLLVVGWGGALLQAAGETPPAGDWRWAYLALLFALMLGFAFSAVPVMVLVVTGFQRRIGSPLAFLATSRWQNGIVFALWALMGLGSAIAIPAMFLLGGFDDFGGGLDPGPSRGTLVAKPGMSIVELKRASSLPVESKPGAPVLSEDVVFDFVVAGTGLRFPRCRYYYISTFSDDPEHIQGISIGTSTAKVDRRTLATLDRDLRRRLAADGWLTGHAEYHSEASRTLHGGATQGPEGNKWLKDGTVLDIESKRMDEAVAGEDAASAGEWIQAITLWAHDDAARNDTFVFAPPRPGTLQ